MTNKEHLDLLDDQIKGIKQVHGPFLPKDKEINAAVNNLSDAIGRRKEELKKDSAIASLRK